MNFLFYRLLSVAPVMSNGIWDISKYFLDQLSVFINKINTKRQQLSSNITCHLAITEYGRSKLQTINAYFSLE